MILGVHDAGHEGSVTSSDVVPGHIDE